MAPSSITAVLQPQVGDAEAASLAAVLAALTEGARRVLGDGLVGVYLTGSFAIDAGDEASDVDFLVVSDHDLTGTEEASAREVHAILPDRSEHWARHLEGSWVSAHALGDAVGAHDAWLYVDNGSSAMERSRHDDTWNSRWLLREAAVPLTGPPAHRLVPPVDPAALRAEAAEQAGVRAAWIRGEPEALHDGWAQPYVVLTHCRLLWAATFGTVASKGEAAAWVRDQVAPSEFQDLVTVAILHRRSPFDPATNRADPALADLTAAFVRWATREVRRRASVAA
ncbi:hypothetical protein GCM10025867_05160 [Frondihabitans sucicola]|uniref:DUF4111 domain-containing protein n=1 Tax=Frondihabitans sucicola TaxID=1268041 RepID=A0ABM8GIS5_9MICO|nr:aminoglycoside adenylyltransferase domain-containing protein [Frondihabitans sucicola]BDZ48275.1 hypothetical protein GCM10025867_05160 [Frondihabitans sucicola]